MSGRDLSEALDNLYDAVTELETQVRAQTSDAQPAAASLDPMAKRESMQEARAAVQVESDFDEEGFEIPMERMTVEPMTKPVPAKSGWQTTEWWATVLVSVGSWAAAQQDALPPRYAAIAAAVSVSAYAISRALAKF